jgi:hypothetical protein
MTKILGESSKILSARASSRQARATVDSTEVVYSSGTTAVIQQLTKIKKCKSLEHPNLGGDGSRKSNSRCSLSIMTW